MKRHLLLLSALAVLASSVAPAAAQVDLQHQPWGVYSVPGRGLQATITKAARTGFRHVCTSVSASLVAYSSTACTSQLVLRNGATGAGTILWTHNLSVQATTGLGAGIAVPLPPLAGSVSTAMTLEFVAADAAATDAQTVSMTGYDI